MDEQREAISPVTVFYSYAHEDEPLRKQLEKHLSILRRKGIISDWHDRRIAPGTEWAYSVNEHLKTSSVILLLISSDFLASDYCYSIEMQQALERHKTGEARVIPVILRPVDWQDAPFAHLQCLPHNAQPVTLWANQDEAFRDVARGIRTTVEEPGTCYGAVQQSFWLPRTISPLLDKWKTIISVPTRGSNRQRMLARVYTIWIKGLLEQSLHDAALMTLGLDERPDLVTNPWRLTVQELDHPARSLPSGTRITEAYDDASGELLILGEPGSGKTTLLLELACDLLDRAQQDDTLPIPVVFNLSSWAEKRQPLADWMVEELIRKYHIPHKLAQAWLDVDQVLPLLDGLDEVSMEHRSSCIDAINAYKQLHGLVSIVVCSRSAEYLMQQRPLELHNAVTIQPLTTQQIDDYLLSVGEPLASLRTALYNDPILLELASTPLMLSVLVLTYEGEVIKDIPTVSSFEAKRQQVLATYVKRMLQHRRVETHFTTQQTIHWLAWLARQMVEHDQTEFYIEHMQPDWLFENRAYRIYQQVAMRLPDMLVGAIVTLLFITMLFSAVFSLPFAFCYGIVGGLAGEQIGRGNLVRPSAKHDSSRWRSLWHDVINVRSLRSGLIVGLSFALVYGINFGLKYGLAYGLTFGLMGDLLSAILEKRMVARPLVKMAAWSWKNLWYQLINFGYLGTGLLVGLGYALVRVGVHVVISL